VSEDRTPPAGPADEPAGAPGRAREPDWKRKQRLARIFGDVLPQTTADERDGDRPEESGPASDAWLKSQVPPHHGG